MPEYPPLAVWVLSLVCVLGLLYFAALARALSKDVVQRDRDIQFWRDKQAETFDSLLTLRARIVGRHLYAITVTDWGPDFDGQNGNLHRWRWVVSGADQDLKKLWGDENDLPYLMLGNEPTVEGAYLKAVAWVEKQENPLIVVSGDLP